VIGVGFHKGGVNLDEGGVRGFGIAGEGGRSGKDKKRGRKKREKKKKGCEQFF